MNPLAHRFEADSLMVIVPDRLSALITKGEVVQRYYNPGELFRNVHIVLTNDDRPDPASVQPMVGAAKLFLHNLDPGPRFFHRTLGWQSILIRRWLEQGIDLARRIDPDLVRTYNNFLEGRLATEIKTREDVPFVTSLHGVWDRDSFESNQVKEHVIRFFRHKLERRTLRSATATIAVYKPILRYAERLGARNVHLIYNAVSANIVPKANGHLNAPPRLITINRQQPEKNPENIIRAVAPLDCHYTIVGDGVYHERLKAVARECGAENKIEFIRRMPNDELCRRLSDYDIMVSHCDYWGISKSMIEASLAGLPIVLNHHPLAPIPDCEGGWLVLCDNTPVGYRNAITRLIGNDDEREALHHRALAHARQYFDPNAMESAVVDVYRSALSTARG